MAAAADDLSLAGEDGTRIVISARIVFAETARARPHPSGRKVRASGDRETYQRRRRLAGWRPLTSRHTARPEHLRLPAAPSARSLRAHLRAC